MRRFELTQATHTALLGIAALSLVFSGCGKSGGDKPTIKIDGSSTVYPITEAVAEEFMKSGKGRVTIGVSGTGGGFKKFCSGETAITGASRPIKPSEVKLCGENKVEYIELPVAYDGIAVVVHKDAAWVDQLTVAELKKMWAPEAQKTVTKWSDVRAGFPDEELHLFGAGVDSGTYDYFTKAIVGTEHSSRGDYTSSEDDNVIVKGVANDKNALGFFGFAYYNENKDKLKIVPVKNGDDAAVVPTVQTIGDGTYQPLSRPIFIYIAKKAAERAEVKAFIDFYFEKGAKLVQEVGYIPLPDKVYGLAKERFTKGTTGSIFGGKGAKIGVSVEALMSGGK